MHQIKQIQNQEKDWIIHSNNKYSELSNKKKQQPLFGNSHFCTKVHTPYHHFSQCRHSHTLHNPKPSHTSDSIVSYGIVLYTYEKNRYLKYLICQRRDSIAFIQFMQNLIDEHEMEKYIHLMTREEKQRCIEFFRKKDPSTIWKDLWINNKSRIGKFEYKRCHDSFLGNVEKYLHLFEDKNIGQRENAWGFPKGRRQNNETDIQCAMREFEEETNISKSDIFMFHENATFEENYIGSNGLHYKTVYFMAYIPYIPKKEYRYYPNNLRKKFISAEIYDMEWCDFHTALHRLNEPKQKILEEIHKFHLKKR